MQKDPEGPVPISYIHVFHKEYPRFKKVDLPAIDYSNSEFETALDYRESTRSFSDDPLKLEHLSKVLQTCRIVDPNRNPERRTYPSGGARFPVELYVICYNIENLPRGVYHYNIRNRNLEVLLEKDLNTRRRELISEYLDNPAASIFLTTVLPRSEIKYGHKGYTYSFIEAGHIGQNMQIACVELGIGCCSVSGFVDDTVSELLDLVEDEFPIYSICIGNR